MLQTLGQPLQSLLAGDGSFPTPLHRANDRRGVKTSGQVDNPGDEIMRVPPDFRIWIREPQFVHHPACAGANGRQFQSMLLQELLSSRASMASRKAENFHRIKTQSGRLLASCSQVFPKHEWPSANFGHQGNSDGALNHACVALLRSNL